MSFRLDSRRLAASVLCILALAGTAQAQVEQMSSTIVAVPRRFTTDELKQLVGPIALYPDPLLAQMLPASTYPIEIVMAARLVRAGATELQIDAHDWDSSVKALTHFPSVLDWMDTNINWTQQLGDAFAAQPEDVMQAIQLLRFEARSLGNLVDSQQQYVLLDDSAIRILPANAYEVYVPVYQPAFVYYQRPAYFGAFISFGIGCSSGAWLDLDCDWRNHYCYRPGWTWNHWRDNIECDHDRVVRIIRPVEVHRDHDDRDERPSFVWRHDDHKNGSLHRRSARPTDFDAYRGREHNDHLRQNPFPRPGEADRGRERTPAPRQPDQIFDPRQSDDQTRRALERGSESRRSPAPRVAPTPAPQPVTPPRQRESPRQNQTQNRPPAPAPAPAPGSLTPRQAAPATQNRPAAPAPGQLAPLQSAPRGGQPAPSVSPPPVRLAPPPAAPATPPLTSGGAGSDRGNKDRKPH